MNSRRAAFAASLAAAVLAFAGRAGADPIDFDQTPLSNIVAQLGQQYGVRVVLEGTLTQNPQRAVTLHIGDPGTTPTRLQAINALANAAGVDFQKGIVVSKISSEDVPPPVKIDSNGYVVFKNKTFSARDAIAAVATTDNATFQVGDDVTGDVTFPKMTMRTADAAAEIARQTHTRWRVYYALTPHGRPCAARSWTTTAVPPSSNCRSPTTAPRPARIKQSPRRGAGPPRRTRPRTPPWRSRRTAPNP